METKQVSRNLDNVHVFWVCECDAVAALSLDEALEWYKSYTGLEDEDLYDYDEIETIGHEHLVYEEEGSTKKVTVRSILEEIWEGEPVIAVSRY